MAGSGLSGLKFFLRGEAAGSLGEEAAGSLGEPPGALGYFGAVLGRRRGDGLGDLSLEIVLEGGSMAAEPANEEVDSLGLLPGALEFLGVRGGECVGGRGAGRFWRLGGSPCDEFEFGEWEDIANVLLRKAAFCSGIRDR